MNNKRILSSVMAAITLLGITSCSQTGERSDTTQPTLTAASTTTTTAAATLAEEDKQALAEVEKEVNKRQKNVDKCKKSQKEMRTEVQKSKSQHRREAICL